MAIPQPQEPHEYLSEMQKLIDEHTVLLATLEKLSLVITQDKNGDYFICKEAKLEVDDARRVVEMVETR